jgi:hypothetical protein
MGEHVIIEKAVPGLPAVAMPKAEPEPEPEIVTPTDVFVLHYRAGSNVLFMHFRFRKPSPEMTARDHFRAAVERAKSHCERMRYRFNFCLPFITDLDEAEKRMPI